MSELQKVVVKDIIRVLVNIKIFIIDLDKVVYFMLIEDEWF